jgi:CRP-like cAMP-binding protein
MAPMVRHVEPVCTNPAASALPERLARLGTRMHAERDMEIFGQGDPALSCYIVLSGCVRTVRLIEDGPRQIGEFLLPGDLLGWESLDWHAFAAEAVTPTELLRFRRASLDHAAEADPGITRCVRILAARQCRAAREHVVLLGRKTATERVATFFAGHGSAWSGR